MDAHNRPVSLACWPDLHIRKARAVAITVVRVTRASATDTKRDPRESWFWWRGGPLPPLAEVATFYPHRFGQEHGYRTDKQQLLWDAPHVRTPDQMQCWTDPVAMVRNQLVLACPLVRAERRPWEASARPTTPQHVRRALGRIIPQLGTPAPAPQPRGKAPGRAVGVLVKRALRHPVIRKGAKTKQATKKTPSTEIRSNPPLRTTSTLPTGWVEAPKQLQLVSRPRTITALSAVAKHRRSADASANPARRHPLTSKMTTAASANTTTQASPVLQEAGSS